MYTLQKNQRQFFNFSEMLHFLSILTDDIDMSRQTPNYALYSKSRGIVGGMNFMHLCQMIRDTFKIGLIPSGCVESITGYILTFEEGYLDKVKPEERKDLNSKTKAELLALAKEKGLEVSNSMKKEEILSAILAS